MIEVKANFKGKYTDLACRLCKRENETQDHILNRCSVIRDQNFGMLSKKDLFEDNIIDLKKTAKIIENVLDFLESETSTPE